MDNLRNESEIGKNYWCNIQEAARVEENAQLSDKHKKEYLVPLFDMKMRRGTKNHY